MAHDTWQSPLMGRYASKEMQRLFSDDMKFGTWRRIWLELARAQQQLGITKITDEALRQMETNLAMTEDDYEVVRALEKKNRHDVQSHAERFGQLCPAAAPIIHLGATSMEVDDNAYLIVMRDALGIIALRVARVLDRLAQFARTWRYLPALAYTHFQPAEPITVGKRTTMWAQDLLMDFYAIDDLMGWLPFRGIQGVTGTQNSFLDLFDGDHQKVVELNRRVTDALGFTRLLTITGQTYTRKIDTRVILALADLSASMHKMCTDLRLLANAHEIEEPFEPGQVGSSYMPFKKNPMREERNCALDRHPMALAFEALFTQATQWLERTLDDSAARRIYIPEAFLATDAALLVLQNVVEGLTVYPAVIRRNLMVYLPFFTSGPIINAMVRAGGSRQETHERLRMHALAVTTRMKGEAADNDFIQQLKADEFFQPVHDKLDSILEPSNFIGRAPEQVDEFLANEVEPALEPYKDQLQETSELHV